MEPEADPSRSGSVASVSDGLKTCADCRTTKTPLWRGGPSGPKSLCNACGIRYRKKRRAAMGLKERKKERMEEGKGDSSGKKMSSMKMGMMDFGREIIWKHQKHRRLGEEEEAAVLLMAISSGFVYA